MWQNIFEIKKKEPVVFFRETLMKAFPAPDLRCEATLTPANPCASAGGSEEAMISSALP